MMNNIVEPVQTIAYQSEIDAAARNLQAQRSDIEQLLAAILEKNTSLQQLPGLLKQSYGRLTTLRRVLANFTDRVSRRADMAELTDLSQQANAALQPGESFSFENGMQPLDSAISRCADRTDLIELSVRIREMQALIYAARLEYTGAAECYALAALTFGLSAERQWLYQKDRALVLADFGREFGNNPALEQALSLLKNTVLDLSPSDQRPNDWATTQQAIGTVLGILGLRQGGTRNLENSIAVFEASLSKRDREQDPLQWAEAQNSLGNALGALGHRLGDEEMLENSIKAFEFALEERTSDIALQDRATTQNNLAAVLQSQGQRNKDVKILKRSVEMYREVLSVWTRERTPLDWAATMNNLGTALRLLGEHRKGPRTLEQSVAAYKSALSVRTRERFPLEWAMTQNNLGAALQKLGQRAENPEVFEQAISAYENTLKEWTREKMPMAWGMTLANLGVARRTLAELTTDIESAEKAVDELEMVSSVFRDASHAQYSELSIDQLAKARKLVDELNLKTGKYAGLVKH